MKKLGFTIFAAAVLALPLCAQEDFRADIPFEFSVRNTTAPVGKYVITFQTGSVVELRAGSYYCALLSALPEGPNRSSHEASLVFHRYGNQYFLSQIRTTSTSRTVPMSPTERELKKSTAASARQAQTEIVLAMR